MRFNLWKQKTLRQAGIGFLVGVTVIAAAGTAVLPASGQGGLHFINEKDGGHVVFGQLSNVSSMPQAMGFMLHTVHTNFGERPEVGKFFRAKGSDSMATFFTLTDKNNTHRALTGMLIVSLPPGGKASAGLLYDETAHFGKSIPLMMKHLDEAMAHEGMGDGGGGGNGGSGGGGRAMGPAPLRQTPFQDGSGSVGLPQGWRVTSSYGSAVSAEGPNGSQIHYGLSVPVMDSSNPQERQQIQTMSQGGRQPLPGLYVAMPYGGDPVRALSTVASQLSQKQRQPVPSIQSSSVKDEGNAIGGHCMRVIGQIDRHDGKGVLAMNTVVCEGQPQSGIFMFTIYEDDVKPELVAQEQATMAAIGASYRVNNQVLGQESQAAIGQIHAIGEAATARANASDQWLQQQDANRASANAAYPSSRAAGGGGENAQEQHEQDFSNYQRDLSVITDTQTGEHATTYNSWADALVKTDPNRYQYVATPDLMKGIDY